MWLRQGPVGEWFGERDPRPAASTSSRGSSIGPGRTAEAADADRPAPGEGTGLARYLFAALLAGARLAGAFLAGARLAGALRARREPSWRRSPAGAFLAAAGAADLPAAATAASLVGYAPLTSLGAVAGARTASLNAFTGVIRAFLDALIRMASPVAGFRPMRAAVDLDELGEARNGNRLALRNDGGDDVGESVDDGTTVFNSTSAWTATAFASSLLFMAPIVADARPPMHIFLGTNADFCAQTLPSSARKRHIQRQSRTCGG